MNAPGTQPETTPEPDAPENEHPHLSKLVGKLVDVIERTPAVITHVTVDQATKAARHIGHHVRAVRAEHEAHKEMETATAVPTPVSDIVALRAAIEHEIGIQRSAATILGDSVALLRRYEFMTTTVHGQKTLDDGRDRIELLVKDIGRLTGQLDGITLPAEHDSTAPGTGVVIDSTVDTSFSIIRRQITDISQWAGTIEKALRDGIEHEPIKAWAAKNPDRAQQAISTIRAAAGHGVGAVGATAGILGHVPIEETVAAASILEIVATVLESGLTLGGKVATEAVLTHRAHTIAEAPGEVERVVAAMDEDPLLVATYLTDKFDERVRLIMAAIRTAFIPVEIPTTAIGAVPVVGTILSPETVGIACEAAFTKTVEQYGQRRLALAHVAQTQHAGGRGEAPPASASWRTLLYDEFKGALKENVFAALGPIELARDVVVMATVSRFAEWAVAQLHVTPAQAVSGDDLKQMLASVTASHAKAAVADMAEQRTETTEQHGERQGDEREQTSD